MRTGDHDSALHSIYRSLLWRSPGPVDLDRFSGRRLFPHRRAVWRLRHDREHREFIDPLLSRATAFFAVVCGREPRDGEIQAVINCIRSRHATLDEQVRAVARIRRSADVSAAEISGTRRAVAELYRELLGRPVDNDSIALYCIRVLMGLTTEDGVRREIQSSDEYVEVVLPLKREIQRISTTYLLRPPTPGETQDAIDRFRTRFVTLEDQRASILAGEARIHLGIRPLKLELDITSQCNLRCVMCYFSIERFSKRKRVDLTVEQFARIADQLLPYCSQMSFSIGTEPLLNQGFTEMLKIARRYQVPWIYMNTNAQLLDAPLIERIVDDGLHGLAISIDAATEPTYERIRFGGKFDRLMRNIRALNEEKRRRNSEFPVVTFNFVIMRSNVRELPALVELARELNVKGIVAMHLMPFEGLDIRHESLAQEPELWNRVLAEAEELAERHDIPVAFPDPFELGREEGESLKPSTPVGFQLNVELAPAASQCKFPWVFVGIDPYGTVNPCGYWFEEMPMGNILTEDFESMWQKDAYGDLRREHLTGQLRSACKNCPAAGMGGVDDRASFREIRLGG